MTYAPTPLQKEVQSRLAASQAAEQKEEQERSARLKAAADELSAKREAREAAEAEQRAQNLADLQVKAAESSEQLLRARARSGWQGSPADFERVWPRLREELLVSDALANALTRPALRL